MKKYNSVAEYAKDIQTIYDVVFKRVENMKYKNMRYISNKIGEVSVYDLNSESDAKQYKEDSKYIIKNGEAKGKVDFMKWMDDFMNSFLSEDNKLILSLLAYEGRLIEELDARLNGLVSSLTIEHIPTDIKVFKNKIKSIKDEKKLYMYIRNRYPDIMIVNVYDILKADIKEILLNCLDSDIDAIYNFINIVNISIKTDIHDDLIYSNFLEYYLSDRYTHIYESRMFKRSFLECNYDIIKEKTTIAEYRLLYSEDGN